MASKRAIRRKGCGKKIKYATREAASKAVNWSRWRYDDKGIAAYKCNFCPSWHIGHLPGRLRQALAAKREGARV